MILSLRVRHRWMMPVLGVIAAVGLIVSVLSQKAIPTMDQVPGEVAVEARNWRSGLWGSLPILTAWGQDDRRRSTVTLRPEVVLPYPELLVYWQRGTLGDQPGFQARLLGSLSGVKPRQFVMPDKNGKLLLYSLAQGDIVAAISVEGGGVQSAVLKGGRNE